MQVNGIHSFNMWQKLFPSTGEAAINDATSVQRTDKISMVRQLSQEFDPESMSRNEAFNLANKLIMSREGELSALILPLPPLQVGPDGKVIDLTGTPEGDAIINEKFNMIEQMKSRIEFRKSQNMPTKLHENALDFLNQLNVAKSNRGVNEYV